LSKFLLAIIHRLLLLHPDEHLFHGLGLVSVNDLDHCQVGSIADIAVIAVPAIPVNGKAGIGQCERNPFCTKFSVPTLF